MEGKMEKPSGMQQLGGGCLGVIVVGLVIAVFAFSPFSMVPAGNVGVLTLFGRVTGQTIGEGSNLVNPLARTHLMSVRTQEVKETTTVPSSEGLILQMDTSLLYHVDPAHAGQLYQKVGEDYLAIVVEPLMRSSIREATAKIPPARSILAGANSWRRESSRN
jgi:regulator of protease activity HflC (stomatin/prohibitin superfamily)